MYKAARIYYSNVSVPVRNDPPRRYETEIMNWELRPFVSLEPDKSRRIHASTTLFPGTVFTEQHNTYMLRGNGKVIPLQARCGPEGWYSSTLP